MLQNMECQEIQRSHISMPHDMKCYKIWSVTKYKGHRISMPHDIKCIKL